MPKKTLYRVLKQDVNDDHPWPRLETADKWAAAAAYQGNRQYYNSRAVQRVWLSVTEHGHNDCTWRAANTYWVRIWIEEEQVDA